ncbi:MAG TPA: hypothetical protein V6C72_18790, partial [Chroococcales cyanobacterium]
KRLKLSLQWLAHCPSDISAMLTCGGSCDRLSEKKAAFGFFAMALEIDPDNRTALIQQAIEYRRRNQPEQAVAAAYKAVLLNPHDRQAQNARENAEWLLMEMCGEGEYRDNWDKAIACHPEAGQYYVWRAIHKHEQFQFQESTADCNTAEKLQSCVTSARLCRAWNHLAMHDVTAADADYRKVYDALVENPVEKAINQVLLLKAAFMNSSHFHEDALDIYDKILSGEPNNITALLGKAETLCAMRCPNKANKVLNKIQDQAQGGQSLSAGDAILVAALTARIQIMRGDDDAALKQLDQALASAASHPALLTLKAMALMRKQKFDEAEALLNMAIEKDLYFSEAYWARHQLFSHRGDKSKADSDRRIFERYKFKAAINVF